MTRELLNYDRPIIIREITQTLNIKIATVYTIMTNYLNMQKVCAKLDTKVLQDE